MPLKSKMLFVLIGNDSTGKTTLQKLIIERLCGIKYKTLQVNKGLNIMHPEVKRKYLNASFGNRSIQEKIDEYKSIDEYFSKHFNPHDISFISSHLIFNDVEQIIRNGKEQFYNVTGVFFSNSIEVSSMINRQISGLNWDERLVINNPTTEDHISIEKQLITAADNFIHFLISRTNIS